MTKAELVSKIADKTGVEKLTTLAIVESMRKEIKRRSVIYSSFFSFCRIKKIDIGVRRILRIDTVIKSFLYLSSIKPAN